MSEQPAPGSIHRINVSDGGVPKLPVERAEVTAEGLTTDRQAHPKFHGGPERAVCLLGLDAIERLQAEGHPIEPGTTVLVPFRIQWLDAGSLYVLRYGRECGPNVIVDSERAEITRHDDTTYTLRSVPGVAARLCVDDSEILGVFSPFSWDFVIDQP